MERGYTTAGAAEASTDVTSRDRYRQSVMTETFTETEYELAVPTLDVRM